MFIFLLLTVLFFKFFENPICLMGDHFPIFLTETQKMTFFLLLALFYYFQISHLELDALFPHFLPPLTSALCWKVSAHEEWMTWILSIRGQLHVHSFGPKIHIHLEMGGAQSWESRLLFQSWTLLLPLLSLCIPLK